MQLEITTEMFNIIAGICLAVLVGLLVVLIISDLKRRKNKTRGEIIKIEKTTVTEEMVEDSITPRTELKTEVEVTPVLSEDTNITEVREPETKSYSLVRYRKSLVAKLVLQPELQPLYKELRAKILAYKKVNARLSFKGERFSFGRKTLLRLFVRGKRIYLYYALNPSAQPEKYHLIDVSDKKIGEELPALQKVLSPRSMTYAFQLIEILMAENQISALPEDKLPVLEYDELLYPRSFSELLAEKLIIEYEVKRKTPFKTLENLDTDDEDDEDELVEAEEVITSYNIDRFVPDQVVEEMVVRKTTLRTGRMEIVNLDSLEQVFADGDLVNLETLQAKKLVSKKAKRIKILARGTFTKKLMVEADDYSKQAMKLIIFYGGRVVVLE